MAWLRPIITLCLMTTLAHAVPEDRGSRGGYIGFGGGVNLGEATDEDGRPAGGHVGGAYYLRFGEEVLPNFALGLEISSASMVANTGSYDARFGGLLLAAAWRPFNQLTALNLILGTGVGGGTLTPRDDENFSGSVAGALGLLGAQYEIKFGDDAGEGFVLAPYTRLLYAPRGGDSETSILTVAIGLETGWHWGR